MALLCKSAYIVSNVHALPFTHSFIHSLWQWIWTSDRVHSGVNEKKGEEKGGGRFYFLALSLLSDLMTPHTRPDSPPFPSPQLPRHWHSRLQNPLTLIFFKICHNMNMAVGRGDERIAWRQITAPALALFDLPFSPMHSSTDGLSIDFDLSRLGLALWACGCLSLVGVV